MLKIRSKFFVHIFFWNLFFFLKLLRSHKFLPLRTSIENQSFFIFITDRFIFKVKMKISQKSYKRKEFYLRGQWDGWNRNVWPNSSTDSIFGRFNKSKIFFPQFSIDFFLKEKIYWKFFSLPLKASLWIHVN